MSIDHGIDPRGAPCRNRDGKQDGGEHHGRGSRVGACLDAQPTLLR
ncbi:MAG: hypothetical protein JO041_09675 [Acidobacteria bacterium]|nr:hypothetical protein [Acidobacteriota bacterium]